MAFENRCPFIVVSGLIGVGKTTLTQQLADYLGYEARFEPVKENPYLGDFYADMSRWTFPMQMYLLTARFLAHQEIVWGGKPVVLDRSIYEDTIFARMHQEDGLMDPRDWQTYNDHFRVMQSFLKYPDMIIYLRVDPEIAMARVQSRGRDVEQGMELRYLQRLHEGYEHFAAEMNRYTVVLTLDWTEYMPIEHVAERVEQTAEDNLYYIRSLRRI